MKPKLEPIAHYRKRLERWKDEHEINVMNYEGKFVACIEHPDSESYWEFEANNEEDALDDLCEKLQIPSPPKRRRVG